MTRSNSTITALFLVMLAAAPVMADESITVVADSTLSGNAGYVVHSTPTEDPGSSIFLYEEAGKLRFYATRDFGSQDWDILPTAQYIAPTSPMTVGDSWSFIAAEDGAATVAEAVGQESVTTPAGTFSCFRVDIERVASPGEVVETMWFAWEVGFVRNEGYLDGYVDWRDELQSYTHAGGTGYMPAAVGNVWVMAEITVPGEARSWGGLKSLFR